MRGVWEVLHAVAARRRNVAVVSESPCAAAAEGLAVAEGACLGGHLAVVLLVSFPAAGANPKQRCAWSRAPGAWRIVVLQ